MAEKRQSASADPNKRQSASADMNKRQSGSSGQNARRSQTGAPGDEDVAPCYQPAVPPDCGACGRPPPGPPPRACPNLAPEPPCVDPCAPCPQTCQPCPVGAPPKPEGCGPIQWKAIGKADYPKDRGQCFPATSRPPKPLPCGERPTGPASVAAKCTIWTPVGGLPPCKAPKTEICRFTPGTHTLMCQLRPNEPCCENPELCGGPGSCMEKKQPSPPCPPAPCPPYYQKTQKWPPPPPECPESCKPPPMNPPKCPPPATLPCGPQPPTCPPPAPPTCGPQPPSCGPQPPSCPPRPASCAPNQEPPKDCQTPCSGRKTGPTCPPP